MKVAKQKLIVGITFPGSVALLRGQMQYFFKQGFETYLLAPDDPKTRDFCEQENCILLPVALQREIALIQDIQSLWVVLKHFRRVKPDIVNVGTAKVALLGMIAASLLGIKKRIYTSRGLRYETESGLKRKVLILMEWITARLAHQIICISPSVKDLGVGDGLFNKKKCIVINKGSSNGINLTKFNRSIISEAETSEMKHRLGISNKFVFGFIGRVTEEKGVIELFHAFEELRKFDDKMALIYIGAVESSSFNKNVILEEKNNTEVLFLGSQKNIPLFLSIMDVLVLPSWREGFGNVLIEAAAMGIPVVSTNGTGTRDAVCDGFNGVLVDINNTNQLTAAMTDLKNNKEKRILMGKNGIEWANNFDRMQIWEGMKEIYLN